MKLQARTDLKRPKGCSSNFRSLQDFGSFVNQALPDEMISTTLPFILQALLAAIFFGASAPIAKLLLGDIAPIFLASFLYLGSGTGTLLVKLAQRIRSKEMEAGIKPPDIKWLAGAIISGGIAAPILFIVILKSTPP